MNNVWCVCATHCVPYLQFDLLAVDFDHASTKLHTWERGKGGGKGQYHNSLFNNVLKFNIKTMLTRCSVPLCQANI